ncbi:NACHT domain-containing protein [Roseibium aggregatum]|uniref:NACHT domain-containing protein n=1 Tax=Roseibium aggregatum TaxID=187304 RepID=UPI001E3CD2E1|nr:AAA family ATPase [Roseibium aggregatum]UES43656.1 AAA family ATPase [Roseibium aggregatum]
MTNSKKKRATSTELTGGAGFTYEDTVVAYYLVALLREESAALQSGVVRSVAVQQAGHGYPMDDVIVETEEPGQRATLGLQVKTGFAISSKDVLFKDIIARALETRASPKFQPERDMYGFAAEHLAVDGLRTLERLINWAKSSPDAKHFDDRFAEEASASNDERAMRDDLKTIIKPATAEEEWQFYRHLVATRFDGLGPQGVTRTDLINRLQELVASHGDEQGTLLFDRLCTLVRQGAGTARKWTRESLLAQLRGVVRLKVAPNYADDVKLLQDFSASGLEAISDEIDGIRIERPQIEQLIRERLVTAKVLNVSGLPGCGKSAMLKRLAIAGAKSGPILFLKSDLLEGKTWLTFAGSLGLKHRSVASLLAEIGATGTPILFIDGIDRIRPDHRGIISDIVKAIEENKALSNWKVLATSRDQGLEAYRTWFPASFYRGTQISDVSVSAFTDEEATILAKKVPTLSRLLFGTPAVSEIARRPFFASVLAETFVDDTVTPQTEVDLIAAWWARAGHDALEETVPQRQRALIDLAESGVDNLGKGVPARKLKDATIAQIAALKTDLIVRTEDGGASYSFSHDIFFEWAFFRLLIELGTDWPRGLEAAGEPPLLGRVVGLLAQSALGTKGKWLAGYRALESEPLRSQWRREWLTAPPFSTTFETTTDEFTALVTADDYALLEKLLVWFQAEHTVPNQLLLQNPALSTGIDMVGVAEYLSWPSDFSGWRRLLSWLLPQASNLPVRLLPSLLELFGVWQNALSEVQNLVSEVIVNACNGWLIDLEKDLYSKDSSFEHGQWEALGSEARKSLASALRMQIMRAARAYPAPAIALFDRAVANDRMRREAYNELMTFSPTMVDVSPESIVAVTKAQIMEELPQHRAERKKREEDEYLERLRSIRNIPEKKHTDAQRRFLENIPFHPICVERYDLDDIGISRHDNYYSPGSALHEPFVTLFAKRPDLARALVRDMANHATTGWRQIHAINVRRMGTPLPVEVNFPWGTQTFWGDWRVYNWFMGQLEPPPLECAYLALSYWAFKQIEGGRPTSDVIHEVLEGHACLATLGLALVLALETFEVSETTLPIASCQRIWQYDMARIAQLPSRDLDIFGLGLMNRLTGAKAEAKKFLDSRESNKREVKELAMRFAVSKPEELRERFREALAAFPKDLPYQLAEERSNAAITAELKEAAERWGPLGDIQNYRKYEQDDGALLIGYEPPNPASPAQEKQMAETITFLQEHTVIGWAKQSVADNALQPQIDLEVAVTFAKERDGRGVLARRRDAGNHGSQTVLSAVAVAVIRFADPESPHHTWAWDVMERVAKMAEPADVFGGERIPWHPAKHLIIALFHDRKSPTPRPNDIKQLIALAMHPNQEVSELAFDALFRDPDEHVRWVAAQMAMDLCIDHPIVIGDDGRRDHSANQKAQRDSKNLALRRLKAKKIEKLSDVPPAWVHTPRRSRFSRNGESLEWGDPTPSFNPQLAAKLFSKFPIEAWLASTTEKPLIDQWLVQLVNWTAERMMPLWQNPTDRHRGSSSEAAHLAEWNSTLGQLIARAAPLVTLSFARDRLLAPFLTDDEQGLRVLAPFVTQAVTRHVIDAPSIPPNTFELLDVCAVRVIQDSTFRIGTYRAGEVRGWDMPELIKALLFVPIDEPASGSARFANGDWSQIDMVMPIVTKMIANVGWATFVAQTFMTLCERAGTAYPVRDFALQANTMLDALPNAKGAWSGTTLPARIAATVQRLADANFQLRRNDAQGLLRILDALIDQGDRRSAALEQTGAFKNVQRPTLG